MERQKVQFKAGEIVGQTKEKTGNLIEKAGNNAQYVKDNVGEGGQQIMATAQGVTEAAKDATGVNK